MLGVKVLSCILTVVIVCTDSNGSNNNQHFTE